MKVAVSSEVYEGIEWINDAGIYDPFDWPQIVTILGASGYTASADWVTDHPEVYIEGIFMGFEIEIDDDMLDRFERYAPGWL